MIRIYMVSALATRSGRFLASEAKGPAGKTEVLEPSDRGRMSLTLPDLAVSIMFCSHFTEVKLIKERETQRT